MSAAKEKTKSRFAPMGKPGPTRNRAPKSMAVFSPGESYGAGVRVLGLKSIRKLERTKK